MNNTQRKQIAELIEKIQEVENDLNLLAEEEQNKIDNMPENLQYSDKVERMQEVSEEIDQISGELNDIVIRLEEYS